MKITAIIFSLVLNLNSVWAQDLGLKSDINRNWSYTPMFTKTDKNSVIKVKMFKRYLWVDQKPIQVAETNFTVLKNPQEKIDLKSLSETIKKSFPLKTLLSHPITDGIELEGHWKKVNRYIKMDLIKKGDTFIVVTTFARSGLSKALMPEVNELHSLLKSYDENKTPKTSFIDFFMPEAYAAGFNPADLATFFGGSNVNTGAGTNLFTGSTPGSSLGVLTTNSNVNVSGTVNTNSTIGVSSDVNANWSKTNGTLGDFNSNLTGINTNIGNMNTNVNNNWNNSNTIMDKQATDANKNWADTNTKLADATKVMDKQGTAANANWAKTNDVINTNWAESNKIAAQMMDPNHMAKLAYYTAAGAALGAITMNLAVEGVTAGISYLYELFTGTKKKKLGWEDFQKAISSWDDQLGDLVKLEKIVDEFIGAFDFFSDKNMDNDYLKNLNIAMRDMRFDRDMMMEQFKNGELALGCRRVLYNAADELDQKLKDYEKITQFAAKHNISGNKNENYFCSQLKELQRKLLGAETQMQDLRLAILKAENQFYDKSTDSKEQREKNVDEVNDNVAKTIKRRQEYNLAASDNLKVSFEKEKEEWVNACVDGENPEGRKIKAVIDNRFTHFIKAKGMCRTVFDESHSLKDREAQGQKVFETENKLRADLKLNNNDVIDVKLSEEQMNWLTRIHVDAFCYQYAHGDASKVPAKCKEFPEMLYSMDLSKGYEKAKGAYKDRCEERYLGGIQKLVGK
jgi:hypothetical protein